MPVAAMAGPGHPDRAEARAVAVVAGMAVGPQPGPDTLPARCHWRMALQNRFLLILMVKGNLPHQKGRATWSLLMTREMIATAI